MDEGMAAPSTIALIESEKSKAVFLREKKGLVPRQLALMYKG